MTPEERTIQRLDKFLQELPNKQTRLEFIDLVERVRTFPSRDHADEDLLDWIEKAEP